MAEAAEAVFADETNRRASIVAARGTRSKERQAMTKCTIIGLGEAGAAYAEALAAAGHQVTGFDPVAPNTPAGTTGRPRPLKPAGRGIVLVLTGAAAARSVARDCLPCSRQAAPTRTSPRLHPRSCRTLVSCPARPLSPTSRSSDPSPPWVRKRRSWSAARDPAAVAELLSPLGVDVESPTGNPGRPCPQAAPQRPDEGLASVVVEAVTAGRAAGLEDGSGTKSPGSSPATARQ